MDITYRKVAAAQDSDYEVIYQDRVIATVYRRWFRSASSAWTHSLDDRPVACRTRAEAAKRALKAYLAKAV